MREAFQVFECTWDDSFPLTDTDGAIECHFLLRIDRILLNPKWKACLEKGRGFPKMPVDYGFRDNNQFWFASHSRPYRVPIPASKGTTLLAVQYACTHYDPDIVWQDEACMKIVQVPKIFLKTVIAGIVKEARSQGITEITSGFMRRSQGQAPLSQAAILSNICSLMQLPNRYRIAIGIKSCLKSRPRYRFR